MLSSYAPAAAANLTGRILNSWDGGWSVRLHQRRLDEGSQHCRCSSHCEMVYQLRNASAAVLSLQGNAADAAGYAGPGQSAPPATDASPAERTCRSQSAAGSRPVFVSWSYDPVLHSHES